MTPWGRQLWQGRQLPYKKEKGKKSKRKTGTLHNVCPMDAMQSIDGVDGYHKVRLNPIVRKSVPKVSIVYKALWWVKAKRQDDATKSLPPLNTCKFPFLTERVELRLRAWARLLHVTRFLTPLVCVWHWNLVISYLEEVILTFYSWYSHDLF